MKPAETLNETTNQKIRWQIKLWKLDMRHSRSVVQIRLPQPRASSNDEGPSFNVYPRSPAPQIKSSLKAGRRVDRINMIFKIKSATNPVHLVNPVNNFRSTSLLAL